MIHFFKIKMVHVFTKYLKETIRLRSNEQFVFKYFPKYAFSKDHVIINSSTVLWHLTGMNGLKIYLMNKFME